jgi:hypothetical protein
MAEGAVIGRLRQVIGGDYGRVRGLREASSRSRAKPRAPSRRDGIPWA